MTSARRSTHDRPRAAVGRLPGADRAVTQTPTSAPSSTTPCASSAARSAQPSTEAVPPLPVPPWITEAIPNEFGLLPVPRPHHRLPAAAGRSLFPHGNPCPFLSRLSASRFLLLSHQARTGRYQTGPAPNGTSALSVLPCAQVRAPGQLRARSRPHEARPDPVSRHCHQGLLMSLSSVELAPLPSVFAGRAPAASCHHPGPRKPDQGQPWIDPIVPCRGGQRMDTNTLLPMRT